MIFESARRAAKRKNEREFLQGGQGPWPQPNPAYPEGEAPVVVHVPFWEKVDWTAHIGLRYAASLIWYTPASFVAAFRDKVGEAPTDDAFSKLMTTSAYSKFAVPIVEGGADEVALAPIIAKNKGKNLRKIDFTAMKYVDAYQGMHVAGTMTLVAEKPDHTWEVIAIAVESLVLEPAHRNAFDLAKIFVMQGAAYAMLFTEHPNLHFPFDSVNAVTKTILPLDHVVRGALAPHLRFQLPLNNAVLLSPHSVITNTKSTFYAPFTANMDAGLLDLFVAGYAGMPDHSAYPKFRWSDTPKLVDSEYGRFGRAYYDAAFLPFGRAIAAEVRRKADPKVSNNDAEYVKSWAHFLAPLVPGFPKARVILDGDNLEKALARTLYTLTVGHALDHKCFSDDVSVEQKYLRIRLPAPTGEQQPKADIGKATSWMDRFRARLAHKIFFEPHVITKLLDVDYGFADGPMRDAAAKFKSDLRTVERDWKGTKFMLLDETPASIQYLTDNG